MNTDTAFIEVATSVLLILGMLVFIDVGYRIGRRRKASISVTLNEGMGTVDAAVFGVLGLTLAFTFGGASDRLAVRRAQIVQEANAIGTAYLRVDLLPASEQPALRALYREYLESRIEVFDKFRDRAASNAALDKGSRLQKEIWSRSVAACQAVSNPATSTLVVSALNDMFDITTTRTMATVTHAPLIVLGLLVMLSFLGAMLVGYNMSFQPSRNALHMILFALAIASTIYVVIDLEYPRAGLITLRSMDRAIVELRGMMK
jgi:hypothetical protein